MDGKDIFYEIMKSPGMRKLLGESGNNFLDMDSEEVNLKKRKLPLCVRLSKDK